MTSNFASRAVTIEAHAQGTTTRYRPLWNWFGYDEPNYTYTRDGKDLLGTLGGLTPDGAYARTHNLLTSGDGSSSLKWGSTNAYAHEIDGQPVYDWEIVDRIFDTYIETGITPFVQVGFMPELLSVLPHPYRHAFPLGGTKGIKTGWAYPPNDYEKWHGLVEAWVLHLAERYGHARVSSWPWEVWNEPDGHYWGASREEFFRLYDFTVDAIVRHLPQARIGGPHIRGPLEAGSGEYLRAFLDHCVNGVNAVTGERGTRLDFVAYHAKGLPRLVEGKVQMGLKRHLAQIEAGIEIIGEFPQLAGLPIILGESDPEGCAACSAKDRPENAYRDGPLFGAYTAELIHRTYELARKHGVEIEGSVTWSFMFEDQPYFAGLRELATNGVHKPVLNVFKMLGMLGGAWADCRSTGAIALDEVLAGGVQQSPDVNCLATRQADTLSILTWNYHDHDGAGENAAISLVVPDIPQSSGTVRLRRHCVDERHSNSFAEWIAQGRPQNPSPETYAAIRSAGELQCVETVTLTVENGAIRHDFDLPRQAVSLVQIEW